MEGVGYSVTEQLVVGFCGCGKAKGGCDSTRPTTLSPTLTPLLRATIGLRLLLHNAIALI